LAEARRAFADRRYEDVARHSQEAVEPTLKAALRGAGVEAPKLRDVAGVLGEVSSSFPAWFVREIPWIRELSGRLAQNRALAMYGDERTGVPASEIFGDPRGARRDLLGAERVVTLVGRLMRSLSRRRERPVSASRGRRA
jgi:HEPN domain-containing protein